MWFYGAHPVICSWRLFTDAKSPLRLDLQRSTDNHRGNCTWRGRSVTENLQPPPWRRNYGYWNAQNEWVNSCSQNHGNQPTPVMMVSALTQREAQLTLKALEFGAVDYVPKPSGQISLNMDGSPRRVDYKNQNGRLSQPYLSLNRLCHPKNKWSHRLKATK